MYNSVQTVYNTIVVRNVIDIYSKYIFLKQHYYYYIDYDSQYSSETVNDRGPINRQHCFQCTTETL